MKEEKGFTLAEILAVLTIMGIMVGITVPIVTKSINNSKESLYKDQEKIMLKSAINWAESHTDQLPINKENEDSIAITLGLLKANGYLSKTLANPKTGYLFPDDMKINVSYNKEPVVSLDNIKYNGNYKFEVVEGSGTDLSLSTNIPAIELDICGNGSELNQDVQACLNDNLDKIYEGINTNYSLSYRDKSGELIDESALKTYSYKGNNVKTIDMSKYGFYYIYYNQQNIKQSVNDSLKILMINDTEPPVIIDEDCKNELNSNNLQENISCTDNSGYCSIKTLLTPTKTLDKFIVTYLANDSSGNTSKMRKVITIK